MPTLKPDSYEPYRTVAEYQARLSQLRALYVPERSNGGKQAYWAGTIKQWILLKVDPPGYSLSFYRNCPC